MMKKGFILVLLVLFVLPSAEAGFGVFGTYWDSKDYDELWGGGIRFGTEIFSGVGVEARASYLGTDLFGDDDVELNLIPLEAVVSWTLDVSEAIKPYVGAGLGYYLKDVNWTSSDLGGDIQAKDSFGYFGLAGINVQLGGITLFGEAKYNLISEDDELDWRGSDVEEKYSLDGFSINAGLSFGF
jgi:outer membrane protein W